VRCNMCLSVCVYLYSTTKNDTVRLQKLRRFGDHFKELKVLPTLNCQLKHSCTVINRTVEFSTMRCVEVDVMCFPGHVNAHEDSVMVFT
jgi:hypothetical protein